MPTWAQKQESLDVFNRALSLWRSVGNRPGEALTLNNMGRLYRDLGQHETALDYYNQALPVWREVRNRIGEALALNDMGRAYADLGQGRKALEYFDQAVPIWRETGARRGEAVTLNNAGRVWSDLGDAAKALDLDYRALAIWREVQDRRGEALALMHDRLGVLRAEGSGQGAGEHDGGAGPGQDGGRSGGRGRDRNVPDGWLPRPAPPGGSDPVRDRRREQLPADPEEHLGNGQGPAGGLCAVEVGRPTGSWRNCWCRQTGWATPNRFWICSRSRN